MNGSRWTRTIWRNVNRVNVACEMGVTRLDWLANASATYSGFGGSLASNVPSLRPRSFVSSGSLSESELSIGSNGLTTWWLALDGGGAAALFEGGICWRLFRGGASGLTCGCWWNMPSSFNCAANSSKSCFTCIFEAGWSIFGPSINKIRNYECEFAMWRAQARKH